MPFYRDISENFGPHLTKMLKTIANGKTKLTKEANKNIFLLRCRKEKITPSFLKLNLNHLKVNNKKLAKRFEACQVKFSSQILNIIISDTVCELKNLKSMINHNIEEIKHELPEHIFEEFLTMENTRCEKLHQEVKRTHLKKLAYLLKNTKNDETRITYDTENWLTNLTELEIPQHVKEILSLGPNFTFPYNSKNFPTEDIIASVESCLVKIDEEKKHEIRKCVCRTIHKEKNKNNKQLWFLEKNLKRTKTFINQHQNIFITSADKSKRTVIINKNDYKQKMETILNDTKVYRKIRKDPTIILQTRNNNFIQMLANDMYLNLKQAQDLKIRNALPPKIYGLPKLHKENIPLRPIVSSIQSPFYALQKFLSNILSNVIGKSEYNIKNSWELSEKLKNLKLETDSRLISLDVVSMYTNIPTKIALKVLKGKWEQIKTHTNFTKKIFVDAVEMCITSTYFKYNSETYEQISGLPMGAPLSAVIANLVLEDLELKCIKECGTSIYFYQRYVDDILAIVPENKFQTILETFNQYNENIKFTIEEEINNEITFLDMKITRKNNKLTTEWTTKKTWSGRYLNYHSHTPIAFKKNVIQNLTDRAIKLTCVENRETTLKNVQEIMERNGYPRKLVNNVIKTQVHKHYNPGRYKSKKIQNIEMENKDNYTYVTIPYVKNTSEKLKKILQKYGLIVSNKNGNNTKHLFTNLKDKTEKNRQTHVVYRINCKNCEGTYIGQTKQYLVNRIKAHQNSVEGKNKDKTALKKHVEQNEHEFDFADVKILKKETNERKRMIYEIINIKKDKNSINDRRDVEDLDICYNEFLNL